jgi:hypothetical protein
MTFVLGFGLVACTGEVDIAKTPSDGGGGTHVMPPVGDDGGDAPGYFDVISVPQDGALDDGGWDGWSAGFASEASGPPPSCASAPVACGQPFPGETPFATSQDAANALVGQWSFCGQSISGFYDPNQVGEEYVADGTYYELLMGPNGTLVRNLDPTFIGKWEIDLTPYNGIEIHVGGRQLGGGLSACPPSLDLAFVETRIP